VRFQAITVAIMKIRAFWDIASCSLLEVGRRFRGDSSPWWWRQYAPQKHQSTPRLYGTISQKDLIQIKYLCGNAMESGTLALWYKRAFNYGLEEIFTSFRMFGDVFAHCSKNQNTVCISFC